MARLLLILDWIIVLLWATRIIDALRNIPRIPNLLDSRYAEPLPPSPTPLISVIVPACNEEANIEAAIRLHLAIEAVPVHIYAIDDRSTDQTGVILDRLAAEVRSNLTVIHVTELPPGWLGKPHAMALAARQAATPWLLFTDGDVFFSPDSLLRALNFAQAENADHVALFPTLILKRFGESMMSAAFQLLAFLQARPWRVADPAAREFIGVGAFSLVRADAYRAIGGFEALRMEVVEDLKLGREIKRAGYRQRAAFGPGLVRVRWAEGTLHFIRNVTKNFFAVFRFRTLPALLACAAMAIAILGPFAAVAGGRAFVIPAAVMLVLFFFLYRLFRRYNGVPTVYFLTLPLAAALLIYAEMRSLLVTLFTQGIRWRGTFYSLSELRKHAGPLH